MSDANILRLIIAIAGLAWLAYIWWSAQHKPTQGERTAAPKAKAKRGARVEPSIGEGRSGAPLDPELEAEIDRLSAGLRAERDEDARDDHPDLDAADDTDDTQDEEPAPPPRRAERPPVGVRGDGKIERIVTIYVSARPGETIAGPELVVAAEKAGLAFGDRAIFHRLVDGRPELGPVFSVANMIKPGSFDMSTISELRTPGVSFFMTLPGPMRALDAWDTMLPAAQRLAELLDAQLLDDEKNTLGRQTIQHLRDDLRAFDRQQEKQVIKRSW